MTVKKLYDMLEARQRRLAGQIATAQKMGNCSWVLKNSIAENYAIIKDLKEKISDMTAQRAVIGGEL
ncbi:hypothetical protein DRH29_03250 [candidate division Kazan bacterium]|uniref:Uncharacterized protein n=1 Tax=candidate division Kazan bacterium TaxID=2202143 RepID=A0A420ZCE2_UNCK3|nr:MAG: hypothetical protein DRH29_03250 [candidate division Kazan bacterium]